MDQSAHSGISQIMANQNEPGSQFGVPQNANNKDPVEKEITQILSTLVSQTAIDSGLVKRLCAELSVIRKQNTVLSQQLVEKNEFIEKINSAAPESAQSFLAAVQENGSLKRQLTEMTERNQRLMAENYELRNTSPPRVAVGSNVPPTPEAMQQEFEYLRGRVRQLENELQKYKALFPSANPLPGGHRDQIPRPIGTSDVTKQTQLSHNGRPPLPVPPQAGPPSRGQWIQHQSHPHPVGMPLPFNRNQHTQAQMPQGYTGDQQGTASSPGAFAQRSAVTQQPSPQQRAPPLPQPQRSFNQPILQSQQSVHPLHSSVPPQLAAVEQQKAMAQNHHVRLISDQHRILQLQHQQLAMIMERHQQHGPPVESEGRPNAQPLRIDTNRAIYSSASGQPWPLQSPMSASPTLGRGYVQSPKSVGSPGNLVPAVWDSNGQNQSTRSPVNPLPSKRRHPTPTSNLAAQVIDLTLDDEETETSLPTKRRKTDSDIPAASSVQPISLITSSIQSAEPQTSAIMLVSDPPIPPVAAPSTESRNVDPVSRVLPASSVSLMDQDSTSIQPLEPQTAVKHTDEKISQKSDEWENNPVIMAFLEQAFSSDDNKPSQKKCFFCSERHLEDPEAWPAESMTAFNSPSMQLMVDHIKDIHTVVWEHVTQMKDGIVDDEGEAETVNDTVSQAISDRGLVE